MSETIEERIARLEQIAIDTGEKVHEIKSTCESHRKETHDDMNAIKDATHADAIKTRNAIIGFMASVALLLIGAYISGVFGA